eukprot:1689906-Prymnesium_polylepis.1
MPHRPLPRIVGGQAAAPHAYPFVLALYEYGEHICGASLVSAEWALTAAHCITPSTWEPAARYSVGVQRHDLTLAPEADGLCAEEIEAAEVHRHPGYQGDLMGDDVALLRLARAPRCATAMPALDDGSATSAGTMARVAGWGELGDRSLPAVLQWVDIPLLSDAECEAWLAEGGDTDVLFTGMLCAGY